VTSDRRRLVGREQQTTPFNTILLRLCDATSASGAALVDCQGETVDFAGRLDAFDIKIAAAEWRIVLDLAHHSRMYSWPEGREILARGSRHSFAVVSLAEGYAIVLQLVRHAFCVSSRALAEAVRDLSREAGLPQRQSPTLPHWTRVEVLPSIENGRRPQAVWRRGSWSPVVVLGRYREGELPHGEVGYRVRVAPGADITLVREPLGVWYADDILEL
jgi:hypothetical protein